MIKHGIDASRMDTSADPRRDFYRYACGGWMDANPLKGEYASYGHFTELSEKCRKQMRELIEGLKDDPEAKVEGSIPQKVKDIYEMGLDMERRDREGAAPIMPVIDRIMATPREDLTSLLAFLMPAYDSPLVPVGPTIDPDNSDLYIIGTGELGLGLGDRDYYLEDNEINRRIMEAYERYVKRLFSLIGRTEEECERAWINVITWEKELAANKRPREEWRDPLKSRNITTIADLEKDYPSIDWKGILDALHFPHSDRVNVTNPDFLRFIDGYIARMDFEAFRDVMVFGVTTNASSTLSNDFYEADFELYSRVMSGIEEHKPLWKRAMAIPNSMFGEALGQIYVKRHFPKENKEYMVNLVENLRKALASHISGLPWMGEATKAKALGKLAKMKAKIGYPDKWKDYSEIKIDPSLSYNRNIVKAAEWFFFDNVKKIGTLRDKEEWFTTPQVVNAYYSPRSNEICFPAGILQPPFFDITADDAINYGAIGAIIGHEMTHGFDDSGRKFDEDGNITDWWTPEDASRFEELAGHLEKEFNAIEVAPGIHANGKYTLGENIADQGGLRLALTAYLENCPESASQDIDGFSPLQRFYLAYAGNWATNIRPEEVVERTKTDPHSLPLYRVNETLRNISEFHEAFATAPGDTMFLPENERTVIW